MYLMSPYAIGEKINATPKVVVTGKHPLESLEWGEFEPPTQLSGTNIEDVGSEAGRSS
jgi:hypothetical protein